MEISLLVDGEFADKIDSAWLEGLANKILELEKAPDKSELGILITGEEHIHELNRDYLGEDRPTDVLSFSMRPGEPQIGGDEPEKAEEHLFVFPPDGIDHLGEVIISYPQSETQAKEHGHSVDREIAILLIHGVLHVLGYDHAEPAEEQEMRNREAEILVALGDMVK